jgi:hypothetical protein
MHDINMINIATHPIIMKTIATTESPEEEVHSIKT